MPPLLVIASNKTSCSKANVIALMTMTTKKLSITASLLFLSSASYVHADSMSALIAQKSIQSHPQINASYTPPQATTPSNYSVPSARVSTRSTIKRAGSASSNYSNTNFGTTANNNVNAAFNTSSPIDNTYRYKKQPTHKPAMKVSYRYPNVQRQPPKVLPAFLSGSSLSGSYDNVDSEYLPLLSRAEAQSSAAARGVISMARKMALNERTIIQGGCWDYLDAVFKRAGVTRDTLHKGTYAEGPYANSNEIELGDWLYYINHGYNGVEHSGLFVGWVDEAAKQALILSYAGENRQEPARYRVYDLSNVYQIMRPSV